jgi:hypothetical protein
MVASLENLNREVRAGGGAYTYVVKQGGELAEVDIERDDLITPEEDAYRCLEFYGIATEPYTVTFANPGEEPKVTTKINILLRIIDQGDAQHKGIFSTSVTFESCGPKSTMGQIFAAILGEPFVGSINNDFWEKVIGGRFAATFTRKEKADATYMNLVHGSPRPAREKKAAKAAAPTPPANPFEDDDEE